MSTHSVSLTVNGETRTIEVEPRRLLVHAIREGLASTPPAHGPAAAVPAVLAPKEERDAVLESGMVDGARETFDRLEEYVATLAPAR